MKKDEHPIISAVRSDAVVKAAIKDKGTPQALVEEAKETALTTAGQRNVNLIWETTQRFIALSVTWVALGVSAGLALVNGDADVKVAACVFIYGVANLVIGFYFGRTNHQKVGGVEQGR